jgi:diguanylate cyclase (GGDEF)-like protein
VDQPETTSHPARAGGALLLVGAAIGLLDLVRDGASPHGAARWAIVAVAALVAVVLLSRPRAGRRWLILGATLGSTLITADMLLAGNALDSDAQMLYLLVIVFAAWHLGAIQMLAQLSLAAFGYGLALHTNHAAHGFTRWITSVIALAVAGGFVAATRRTLQGVVAGYEEQARRDELTGLLGRHAFEEHLASESARLASTGKPLSIVLADIAGIGRVNEHSGFHAGDDVLRRAAVAVGRETRAADPFARWAGTEFALLLPDCPADRAREVAERMRDAVAAEFVDIETGVVLVAGVATAETTGDTDGLLPVVEAARFRARAELAGGIASAGEQIEVSAPDGVAAAPAPGYPSAVSR